MAAMEAGSPTPGADDQQAPPEELTPTKQAVPDDGQDVFEDSQEEA